MTTYRIASAGDGFRIIGEFPDGRKRVVGGFFTRAEASSWLCEYLRQTNAEIPPIASWWEPSDNESPSDSIQPARPNAAR
jgi:hypothetical protein